MSRLQSIIFDRKEFTPVEATKWLEKHKLHAIKDVHSTTDKLHLRITDPNEYKMLRTISLTPSGSIKAVVGISHPRRSPTKKPRRKSPRRKSPKKKKLKKAQK